MDFPPNFIRCEDEDGISYNNEVCVNIFACSFAEETEDEHGKSLFIYLQGKKRKALDYWEGIKVIAGCAYFHQFNSGDTNLSRSIFVNSSRVSYIQGNGTYTAYSPDGPNLQLVAKSEDICRRLCLTQVNETTFVAIGQAQRKEINRLKLGTEYFTIEQRFEEQVDAVIDLSWIALNKHCQLNPQFIVLVNDLGIQGEGWSIPISVIEADFKTSLLSLDEFIGLEEGTIINKEKIGMINLNPPMSLYLSGTLVGISKKDWKKLENMFKS